VKAALHIVAKPEAPVAAIPLQPSVTPPPAAAAPKPTVTALFTHRATVASLTLLACGLTAWSLVFRLPRIKLAMPVQARAASPVSLRGENSITGLTAEAIQQRTQEVRDLILPDREALLPVLARLEQTARAAGWSFGVTMKPAMAPMPAAPGISRVPVAVVLQAQPVTGGEAPPFARLAALLRQVSLLPKKVEVTSLVVRASPQGISEAELELVFWTLNPDEEAAPK